MTFPRSRGPELLESRLQFMTPSAATMAHSALFTLVILASLTLVDDQTTPVHHCSCSCHHPPFLLVSSALVVTIMAHSTLSTIVVLAFLALVGLTTPIHHYCHPYHCYHFLVKPTLMVALNTHSFGPRYKYRSQLMRTQPPLLLDHQCHPLKFLQPSLHLPLSKIHITITIVEVIAPPLQNIVATMNVTPIAMHTHSTKYNPKVSTTNLYDTLWPCILSYYPFHFA